MSDFHRSVSLEEVVRLESGKIADYSTVRERLWGLAQSRYGAAAGGGWTGFAGRLSLFISLAAFGNVIALGASQGFVTDKTAQRILGILRQIHVDLKAEAEPF